MTFVAQGQLMINSVPQLSFPLPLFITYIMIWPVLLFLPIVGVLTNVKTPSLLPDGRTHVVLCQCGGNAQLRSLCVGPERFRHMQKTSRRFRRRA